MYFVAHCLDRPNAQALRAETRPRHLAYLETLGQQIVIGGPYLSADGTPIGSMLLLEVPDHASAEAILANDPYAQAGLFQLVEIRAWRWVVNPPAGS
jgi:uncharacterized protein YciI